MKNLISNIAFGDFLRTKNIPDYEYRYLRDNFDNLLKKPLELWMFVPCKLVNNFWVALRFPIEPEPPYNDKKCDVWMQYEMYLTRYQQAKERCLFENINEQQASVLMQTNGTIEDLIPFDLQLNTTNVVFALTFRSLARCGTFSTKAD